MTHILTQEHNTNSCADNIIIFCNKDKELSTNAKKLDSSFKNLISTYLNYADFTANKAEITKFALADDKKITNIYIVSLGDVKNLDASSSHSIGLKLSSTLKKDKVTIASLINDEKLLGDNLETILKAIIWFGYDFNEYKSKNKTQGLLELSVQVNKKDIEALNTKIEQFTKINKGVDLARDLVNHPANIVTPEYMLNKAKELKKLGVKVTSLNQKQLEKEGLNLLVSVGMGSANQPHLVTMKYNGAGKGAPTYALVGKGITFDTGGYNLKLGAGMASMKSDMGGAAATIGTIKALAELKAPINVIGVMPCAENMISDKAVKTSDIHTAYNGLTVENMNTDAEGRLVLADALAYTLDKNDCDEIIDIATLTGACMVALGSEYAGLMSYNDSISQELLTASNQSHDYLWRLPMNKFHTSLLKSDIADFSNISSSPYGGALTAGEFLSKFVGDTKWAHLDISGLALAGKISSSKTALGYKGATGFGVQLLTKYYLNKVAK